MKSIEAKILRDELVEWHTMLDQYFNKLKGILLGMKAKEEIKEQLKCSCLPPLTLDTTTGKRNMCAGCGMKRINEKD